MKAQHILDRARRGLTLTTATLLLAGGSLFAGNYQLDSHTIQWSGSMPAKTHTGLLTPQSFDVSITDDGKVESLNAVLDMSSIDVTDLEGKNRKKLTKHLLSEDFFFVEKYPTAIFNLEQFEEGKLHGTITIRGVSKPVVIPVSVKGHPDRGWILTGAFTFNRQDFNVNYQNGGLFGVAKDKLIRDEVELDIEVKVTQG
ncbi:MAG: YceI family protein [Oceanipulchritudo sp.]